MKFLVNARGEHVERGRVAAGPGEQKLRSVCDWTVCFHGGFRTTGYREKYCAGVTVFARFSRMEVRERYFPDNFQGGSYK